MSNRSQPHPVKSDYYRDEIDFQDLADEDASLAAALQSNKGKINWQDPDAVQSLTKAILNRDFNLTLTLPSDRLCPPVPVRWNYIRWMQSLLDSTSPSLNDSFDPGREVTGLDIGVGASCIYALLACASRANWRMLGSDIDAHSLSFAQRNVDANTLASRIKLRHTAPTDSLLPPSLPDLDFVVCNPPFYASESDMHSSAAHKSAPPSAVCTGAPNEMVCEGGDIGFALRLLDASLRLPADKIQWASIMLGRLASVQQLVARLRADKLNFAVANLQAGRRTRRWAVAWSRADFRPRNAVARHGDLVLAVLPPATEWTVSVAGRKEELGSKVHVRLSALEVRWQFRASVQTGVVVAAGNVWSRAARRRKKFQGGSGSGGGGDGCIDRDSNRERGEGHANGEDMDEDDDETIALVVKITCLDDKVDLRWLRGSDPVLFESFCGMLKRALGAR